MILAKVYFYRLHNPAARKHVLLVVIEEARKPLSAKAERDYAVLNDPFLQEMMTKCRQTRIACALVTHEPSSISKGCRSNVYTTIAMQLSEGEEIATIAKSQMLSKEQTSHFRSLGIGKATCTYAGYPKPFLIETPDYEEDFPPDPPTDEEIEQAAIKFHDENIPVQPEPEDEADYYESDEPPPEERSAKPAEKKTEETPDDCFLILNHLAENPFTIYKDLKTAINRHSDQAKPARDWLEKEGYIIVHRHTKDNPNRIFSAPKRHGMFFELTEKGLERMKAKPPKGKGSFKHRKYQDDVAKRVESSGGDPEIEANLDGKLVDVFDHTNKTAYEITLHFENLLKNVEQDFQKEASKVVIVVERSTLIKKAREILKNHEELNKNIELKIIADFLRKEE